jgi:hypothetical protein
MRRRLAVVLSLAIIVVVIIAAFATVEVYNEFSASNKKPFYVGVTYGGSSVMEAEQLIDKVKNYTNLFVVQSGSLMSNLTGMEQICDYAVNAGLNIIVSYAYYGAATNTTYDAFLAIAPARWGSHFLGLYYNDEPGGKMLDGLVSLYDNATGNSITKSTFYIGETHNGQSNDSSYTTNYFFFFSGEIDVTMGTSFSNPTVYLTSTNNYTTYFTNGTISFSAQSSSAEGMVSNRQLWYQPNGEVQDENGALVTDAGSISQFEPYQQLWDSRPLQTYTGTANIYVSTEQKILNSIDNQTNVNLFTSDYGLYWFDYQAGYDNVFAELFGTQTDAQTLALVRGAADMQGKSWGVMIEPANQSPTLQTGDQIYGELQQAYEDGAEYGVVFNYAPNSNSTAGLLQEEQFNAVQRFWTDVVQNPKVTNNVKGQDALVLPNDYGSGLRSQTDTIWGIWQPDNSSQQVWNAIQQSLAKYGSKLDIIYDTPNLSPDGKYQHIVNWNQTT